MIHASSDARMLTAMQRAHSVYFSAYVLWNGTALDRLEEAARRGAHVTVRLEGRPYADASGSLTRANLAAVKKLRQLGADARVVDTQAGHGPALHMKAAVCDGTAYLDDRNWPGDGADSVLRDDFPADVRAVIGAITGRPAPPAKWFWTRKDGALAAEARLLYGAAGAKRVDVESESFGVSKQTYAALKRLAQSGVRCRLLVAERDLTPKSRHALDFLKHVGVRVRVGESDEKMALVDRKRAWAGSANSTSTYYDGDQIDWGVRTDAAGVVGSLQRHFNRNWSQAAPVQKPRAH